MVRCTQPHRGVVCRYVKEFQKCLDRTEPIPFSEIKRTIQQEMSRPLDSIFESIDPVPLASASIAQVHTAVLKGSNKEVVLKVLKPGVSDILTADLSFLYAPLVVFGCACFEGGVCRVHREPLREANGIRRLRRHE
jgi:predicted unusual protein kinase regulating ubiquinone biosynthesis (AarF/ABC1/UbiB family)